MTRSRTRGLNFSFIAASIGLAVHDAATQGVGSVVVMDLNHPDDYRIVKTDESRSVAAVLPSVERARGSQDPQVALGNGRECPVFVPVTPARRSPVRLRRSKSVKNASAKISPAKATKPKPPPLRPRRRPGRKS